MKKTAAGFSLIELAIVMVIISIGLLGLTGLFSTSVTAVSTNETLQLAAQYAQECVEKAVAQRRNNDYDSVTSSFTCGDLPTADQARFTRSVTVTDVADGDRGDKKPCPSNMECKDVVVTVTSTQQPELSSTVNALLVYY